MTNDEAWEGKYSVFSVQKVGSQWPIVGSEQSVAG